MLYDWFVVSQCIEMILVSHSITVSLALFRQNYQRHNKNLIYAYWLLWVIAVVLSSYQFIICVTPAPSGRWLRHSSVVGVIYLGHKTLIWIILNCLFQLPLTWEHENQMKDFLLRSLSFIKRLVWWLDSSDSPFLFTATDRHWDGITSHRSFRVNPSLIFSIAKPNCLQ